GKDARAGEERGWLTADAAPGKREYAHASRRYDETAAGRDAVAQDLAQVATERRNIRHNAVGLLRARDRLIAERDALAARLAAVEALADEWERRAQLAESTADARAGLSDEVSLRQHAVVVSNRAAQLRAGLRASPTDAPKETPRAASAPAPSRPPRRTSSRSRGPAWPRSASRPPPRASRRHGTPCGSRSTASTSLSRTA